MQNESISRGVKRKRKQPQKAPVDVTSKFSGKLHFSLREVQRAAKKAKVYETQRIVKRLKKCGSSSDKMTGEKQSSDTEDTLEKELRALKLIDTDAIMKNALLTRVGKDGVLGRDERVKTVVMSLNNISGHASKSAGGSSNQEVTGKLEARIRSSKKVADVMKNCVDSLRDLVLGKEKEKKQIDIEGNEEVETEEDEELEAEVNLTGEGAGADDERSPGDGFSDAGWESGSIDDAGLRNGEEEEGGIDSEWESGSVSSDGKTRPTKKKVKVKTSKDLPQKPPVQAALASAAQSQAQSTFLPSLAAGYIRGGSSADDQWSDVGDPFPKEKKNRRGQRARQAIWEKKYGRNANHVKKKKQELQAKAKAKAEARAKRAPGGTERIGPHHRQYRSQPFSANGVATSPGKPFILPNPDSGYTNRLKQNANEGTAKQKREGEKSLHPSWEAKRKQKIGALGQSGVGGLPIQGGTKIKFD